MSERTTAKAEFTIDDWDEQPYDEAQGQAKLTRASVRKTFKGDLEGTSTVTFLMAYREGGEASFVGLERVTGRLNGKEGGFVLRHVGEFAGGAARGTLEVVPESGTGALRGLRGGSDFDLPQNEAHRFSLTYSLEAGDD